MQIQMRKSQQGFTIIELVVVILLLGILAATALPRFIDVTEQAHDAVFSGVSGSFVTGTALYRAEWVARGQPSTNTGISSYGGLQVAPGFLADSANYIAAVEGNNNSDYTPVTTFTSRASGYPYAVGLSATPTLANYSATNCVQVFDNLLQIGAPNAVAAPSAQITSFQGAGDAAAIRSAVAAAQNAESGDYQVFVRNISLDTGFANRTQAAGTPYTNTTAGQPLNHQQTAPACIYAYSAETENYNRFLLYAPWTGRTQIFTDAGDLYTAMIAPDGPLVE